MRSAGINRNGVVEVDCCTKGQPFRSLYENEDDDQDAGRVYRTISHSICGKRRWLPPNGLPFSCRERCRATQNTNDLAREAVGCNGGLGGSLIVLHGAISFGLVSASMIGIISSPICANC
jgi:hypothetical protein